MPNVRVLFLDDDKERYEFFRPRYIGHTVDWATTAAGAIALLKENEYGAIFLDHDLVEAHYVAFMRGESVDEATTGMAVAKYIAENAGRFHCVRIVVHTANPTASRAMGFVLGCAGMHVTVKAGGWATE